MLKKVIETLYQIDSLIIENLATTNAPIIEWSQRILFSYDKKVVNSDYTIRGTNIYEKTGLSTSYVMSFIKALLDLYDIDSAEFSYYARENK